MVLAIVLLTHGAEWLEEYPRLAKRADELKMLAVAAVLAPPAIAVIRNARRGLVRGRDVRLSRDQIPEIYGILELQCEKLGMTQIPDLYVSHSADESNAFSTWKQNFIVLSTDYLGPLEESHDTIAFFLGRQLGAIRLGHAKWWNELLLWYVLKIPLVSAPVQKARTLSLDRYGAFLSRAGLRPLIILATGRHMGRVVDFHGYLNQVGEFGSFWDRVGEIGRKTPALAKRVRALQEAGLLEQGVRIDDPSRGS
ncbi:MAG TPA: hypothetical protein VFH69_00570 [Gemmatimonadota bacterium]|nr:hypothetical protein [Gemmatimonadota bacterium]